MNSANYCYLHRFATKIPDLIPPFSQMRTSPQKIFYKSTTEAKIKHIILIIRQLHTIFSVGPKHQKKCRNHKKRAFSANFYHPQRSKSTKIWQKSAPKSTNLHFYKRYGPIRQRKRAAHQVGQAAPKASPFSEQHSHLHPYRPKKMQTTQAHNILHTTPLKTITSKTNGTIHHYPIGPSTMKTTALQNNTCHHPTRPHQANTLCPIPPHTQRHKRPGRTFSPQEKTARPGLKQIEDGFQMHAISEG